MASSSTASTSKISSTSVKSITGSQAHLSRSALNITPESTPEYENTFKVNMGFDAFKFSRSNKLLVFLPNSLCEKKTSFTLAKCFFALSITLLTHRRRASSLVRSNTINCTTLFSIPPFHAKAAAKPQAIRIFLTTFLWEVKMCVNKAFSPLRLCMNETCYRYRQRYL